VSCSIQAALDRAHGNSDRFRNLLIGQVLDLSHDEGNPMVLVHPFDGRVDRLPKLTPISLLLRIGSVSLKFYGPGQSAGWRGLRSKLREHRLPSAGAITKLVLQQVVRDSMNPGREFSIGIITFARAMY